MLQNKQKDIPQIAVRGMQRNMFGADQAPSPMKWTDEEITKIHFFVLQDALRAFVDGRKGESSFDEAKEWMLSDEIRPFSFVVCCDQASVSPAEIRERVLHMARKREFPKHHHYRHNQSGHEDRGFFEPIFESLSEIHEEVGRELVPTSSHRV